MLDLMTEFGASEPQQFNPENPLPGFYTDVDNDVYHSAISAVSNSMLSHASQSVSKFEWLKKAPIDYDKLKAFEFGTAVHAMFLEPDRYHREYAVMPNYNLRTNIGKEKREEWERKHQGYYQITDKEQRQISMMCESLWADPRVALWRSKPGYAESVIVWDQPVDGSMVRCRIRPDWLFETENLVVCLDLKSTDTLAKFEKDFFKLRYDVQSAFYRTGIEKHFNKPCLFLFAAVSKTIEIGRYPVICAGVGQADHDIAMRIMKNDLSKLKKAMDENDWIEYDEIQRTNKQREYFYEQLK